MILHERAWTTSAEGPKALFGHPVDRPGGQSMAHRERTPAVPGS
ncbi:hypothetical protein [Streptomyces sp. SID5473]|nr:hypothetical protein [Streptomyces sp. SID5473]